jgi:glutathione S-transferase
MKPTLTYFDMEGRALPIRLAFVVGGVDFEDVRMPFMEWSAFRVYNSRPLAQLPMLKVNNRTISHAKAQLCYAGRVAGLYPSDPVDAARVDEALNIMHDAFFDLEHSRKTSKQQSPEELKECREKIAKGLLLTSVEGLDKVLQKARGDYFLGDELSVADLFLFNHVRLIKSGTLHYIPTTLYDHLPKINALHDRVASLEAVQTWIAEHEKSPMPRT